MRGIAAGNNRLIFTGSLTYPAVKGILSSLSHIILTGLLSPSILVLSIGSSASTVPIPAIMPRYLCRIFWTSFLENSLVTYLEEPVLVAILPSIDMAYFITT